MFIAILAVTMLILPFGTGAARAADGFRLSAPQELVNTGLLKFVLPRFSLKTGVRIELVAAGAAAEVALAPAGEGRHVFTGYGTTWRIRLHDPDHPGARRFLAWLTSEVGQRAVTGFKINGVPPFALPVEDQVEVAVLGVDGNAEKGGTLSLTHCGRCHVVSEVNRMKAIGSTPSFHVLRTLSDWQRRFESFYVLNPHPAFTQITGVTPPFPAHRPPPITPVEITLEDLEAILAYVSALAPADLGAPLRHQ